MAPDEGKGPVLTPEVPPDGDDKSPVFKPHPRRLLKWLVIIAIILLLALGGLLGWLWWRDRNSNEDESAPAAETSQQQQESAEEPPVCDEDFKIYANQDLEIQFCYPIAWGEVTAADAKFTEDDEGMRWRLSFSEKPQINAGLVDEAWSTTAGRDLTCVDPAVQQLPPFSPFSTDWQTDVETDTAPPEPSSATRGIEKEDGVFLLEERTDNLLTNGACLSGYKVVENDVYPFVTATYYAEFAGEVTSPAQHIEDSEVLIPAMDRADFAVFVKSISLIES